MSLANGIPRTDPRTAWWRTWLAQSRARYSPSQDGVPPRQAEMFSFLLGLYVVIVGLGLTRLFEGAAMIVQFRHEGGAYWLHLAWLPLVFLLYVLLWFGAWRYRATLIRHRFFEHCLALLPPVTTYLATALLVPADIGESFNGQAYYVGQGPWIFGLFGVACASFVLVGCVVGGDPLLGLESILRLSALLAFISLAIVQNVMWHTFILVLMYVVLLGIGLSLSITTTPGSAREEERLGTQRH